MKKIILALSLALSFNAVAQTAVTTYTITPSTTTFRICNSAGQVSDFPLNTLYPVFSKDSISVMFLGSFDKTTIYPFRQDSINHFTTGSFHFPVKGLKSLDSFYQAKMTK